MARDWANVVIVGADPAGLSAALWLGRCGRTAVIFDSGRPRNLASPALHGYLTRDGMAPLPLRGAGPTRSHAPRCFSARTVSKNLVCRAGSGAFSSLTDRSDAVSTPHPASPACSLPATCAAAFILRSTPRGGGGRGLGDERAFAGTRSATRVGLARPQVTGSILARETALELSPTPACAGRRNSSTSTLSGGIRFPRRRART